MPYTLLANQVPTVPAPTGIYNPTSGGLTSPNVEVGDTADLVTKCVELAGRLDMEGRFGGGVYGICNGLAISVGSGLDVAVSAGQAMIDGLVTKTAAFTITVSNGASATRYLWLRRDGTSTFTATTTAPAADYLYLGSVVVNAGAQVSVDHAGVMYLLGGIAFRRTADTTTPSDTPPASINFLHYGASKLWLWAGNVGSYIEVFGGETGLPVSLLAAMTASVTVADAASGNETTLLGSVLGTLTIPAAWLTAGRTVRISARGVLGSDGAAPATLNLKVKFGTTVLCATGDQTLAVGLTNRGWELSALVTCRTTGATGTVFAQGSFRVAPSAAGNEAVWDMETTATVTVDTTGTNVVNLTADWGGSDPQDTITATNVLVELLG